MRAMWAVCRRELSSFFITPIGYVVIGTYSLITGLGFLASFIYYARITQAPSDYDYPAVPNLEETMLSPFLVFCGQVMIFLGPLITMKLLAEEKNRGTMELLLTYPLRDRDIIFGKYLASLGMALVMMLAVVVHMGLVAWFTEAEPAVLLFGVVAVFLMAAAFYSLGLFVSAMCSSQITAATVTFGLFFVSYVLGALGRDLPEQAPMPPQWSEGLREAAGAVYGVFRGIVLELPMDAHARTMAEGVVEPQDIAYYVLFAAFFLFLTFRVLESRKWRGL